MASKELSKQELEELLKTFRLCSTDLKKRIAPLVWYINFLNKQVADLREKLENIQQPDLLVNTDNTFNSRLYIAMKKNQVVAEQMIKLKKISRDEAKKLANSFAKMAGYEPIE